MKYMLLIYGDEQALSETERQDCYANEKKKGTLRFNSVMSPRKRRGVLDIRHAKTGESPFSLSNDTIFCAEYHRLTKIVKYHIWGCRFWSCPATIL
jgi:hypothetical protein